MRRTEHHLVAFFPHLCDERLAGIHDAGKPVGRHGVIIESVIPDRVVPSKRDSGFFRHVPDFDVLVRTKRLEYVFARDPHETKSFGSSRPDNRDPSTRKQSTQRMWRTV